MFSGGGALFAAATYLLVGAGLLLQRTLPPAHPRAAVLEPQNELSLLREHLAQRLFCEDTPCPEPDICPAPAAWWWWLVALLLGFGVGCGCGSCCFGGAFAGFCYGRYEQPRHRGSIRALPASAVAW